MSRTDEIFEFQGFRLEPAARRLARDGEELALTPRAFDTLVALVRRRGEVVRKQELLDTVWNDVCVEEAVLTQNVYTLRKLLGDRGPNHRTIATVPRIGYRFVAPVRAFAAAASSADASVAAGDARPARVVSLAVLPFAALGGDDPELEMLGVGLADALTTRLSALPGLVVRPTSAILDSAGDASALDVDAVLEGRLQSSGERVRATVQLVDTASRRTLWGETLDEPADDLFAVQDAISTRLARALRLELGPHRLEAGTKTGRAYRAYLQGRYFWGQRTAEGLERAIERFEEATRLDPGWALPRVGLADCQVLLPFYADRRPAESFPAARGHALHALEREPDLAEAQTVLGYIDFVYDRDLASAEQRLRRAIDLRPGYAIAHQRYAFLLAAQARFEGAVIHGSRAVELDPLSRVIQADLGWVHYFARQYDEAIARFESTLELDARFGYARVGKALTLVRVRRADEAVAEARRAVEDSHGGSIARASCVHVLGRAGRDDEARAELARLVEGGDPPAGRLALAWAGLDFDDARIRALDALERAVEERSRFVVFLGVWPAYDGLRAEPRFRELVEAAGVRSLA